MIFRSGGAIIVVAVLLVSLPGKAGPWTIGEDTIALKSSLGFWQARQKFASVDDTRLVALDRPQQGARIPFDPSTDGRLSVVTLYHSVVWGVLPWLDLHVGVPLMWIDFDTLPVDQVAPGVGFGDTALKLKALAVTLEPFSYGLAFGAKLPTGKFDASIFQAPLSEGQIDLWSKAMLGLSLHPWGYAAVEVGYRLRNENPANKKKPGNEAFAAAEVGVALQRDLHMKLMFDGMWGTSGSNERFPGVETVLPRRRLFSLLIGGWWHAGDALLIDGGLRWLVAGEDHPTGVQLNVGATYSFRL